MIIKEYTKRNLINLLDDTNYWDKYVIPITQAIILKQINNPRAENDDYLLFTVEIDNKIISYMGVVPDLIQLDKKIKIYWLSTWWLDPNFIKTSYAALLFFHVWKKLNKNIAISSFSKSAKEFYKRLNKFEILIKKNRFLFLMNIDEELFVKKYPKIKSFIWFIKLFKVPFYFYNIINFFFIKRKILSENINIEYTNYFDDESWNLTCGLTEKDLVIKDKDYFNWKLWHNPMILSPLSDLNKHHYDFSGYSNKNYSKISYKLFYKNKFIGFTYFTINNNNISLQFNYCLKKYTNISVDVFLLHIYKMKCDSFFIEDEDYYKCLEKYKYRFLKIFSFDKNAIISKNIFNSQKPLKNRRMNFCDGG